MTYRAINFQAWPKRRRAKRARMTEEEYRAAVQKMMHTIHQIILPKLDFRKIKMPVGFVVGKD
jgi:hypothetical protein